MLVRYTRIYYLTVLGWKKQCIKMLNKSLAAITVYFNHRLNGPSDCFKPERIL